MKKRIAVALVALVMIVGCVVGGTLAWLTDTTTEVKNTFTYGDINIDLWENDYIQNTNSLDTSKKVNTEAEYKMVPGNNMPKNPTVTVAKDSEACWLFIKVEESTNLDSFISYAIDDSIWTLYTGTNNIYYCDDIEAQVTAENGIDKTILKCVHSAGVTTTAHYTPCKGCVNVLTTVTKDMMNSIDGIIINSTTGEVTSTNDSTELAARPTLTFKAYAVQRANMTLEAAYAEVQKMIATENVQG